MWNQLSSEEKQVYTEWAKQDLARYEAEIEAEKQANDGERLPTIAQIKDQVTKMRTEYDKDLAKLPPIVNEPKRRRKKLPLDGSEKESEGERITMHPKQKSTLAST